jgi:hypothetical protein
MFFVWRSFYGMRIGSEARQVPAAPEGRTSSAPSPS